MNETVQILTAEMFAKNPQVTATDVLRHFASSLRRNGEEDLDHLDVIRLRLIEKYHWLPSQVRSLSDADIRLCLHTEWQSFLTSLTPPAKLAVEKTIAQPPLTCAQST